METMSGKRKCSCDKYECEVFIQVCKDWNLDKEFMDIIAKVRDNQDSFIGIHEGDQSWGTHKCSIRISNPK